MALKLLFSPLLLWVACLAQPFCIHPQGLFSSADYGEAARAEIKDLDALAHSHIELLCLYLGRGFGCYDYVDIDGAHDKSYPYRKIDIIDVEELAYSVVQKISRPSLNLFQDYCNHVHAPASYTFSQKSSVSSTFSWEVSAGIKSTSSIKVTIGIPVLDGAEFSQSLELDFSTTSGQSTTSTKEWGKTAKVNVPPLTYVNTTYTVVENDIDATWTANVTIRGCANVKLKESYGGVKEWPCGVHAMYGTLPGFKCWFEMPMLGQDICLGSYCTYQASGTYTGIGNSAAHMSSYERPCRKEGEEDFLEKVI